MRTFIFGMLALLWVSGLTKADVVSNLGNSTNGTAAALGNNTISIAVAGSPSVVGSQWMSLTAKLFASGTTGSITGFSFSLNSATYSVSGLNIGFNSSGNAVVDISGANLWAVNGQNSVFALTSVSAVTTGDVVAKWATTTNSGFSETSPYSFASQTLAGGDGTGSNYAQFGVAVPEPGTLLLGGIAALTGGGGFWWKRRRKGAGNSAATEPAVN
jgi:hypothetical protein